MFNQSNKNGNLENVREFRLGLRLLHPRLWQPSTAPQSAAKPHESEWQPEQVLVKLLGMSIERGVRAVLAVEIIYGFSQRLRTNHEEMARGQG